MPKQIALKINTTFIETKPAGLGAKYLTSGEIDTRTGIEIAIGCLFAPLGAAIGGSTRKEIETLIGISRTQFEIYLSLALSRCREECAREVVVDPPSKLSAGSPAEELDVEENINFESEELL